ncbi:hypothetical protein [Caldivirga sp.]|uniref:hypothetical protein n=1 Tax=Caldivirga sp. TaxID=2080243 RepID=UPI0025BA0786|nr:hypothetical protein [Caldivirga sp.]
MHYIYSRYLASIALAKVMLINCPVNLMVPNTPDTAPYLSRLIDPVTEFVFGVEKKPKPNTAKASKY